MGWGRVSKVCVPAAAGLLRALTSSRPCVPWLRISASIDISGCIDMTDDELLAIVANAKWLHSRPGSTQKSC